MNFGTNKLFVTNTIMNSSKQSLSSSSTYSVFVTRDFCKFVSTSSFNNNRKKKKKQQQLRFKLLSSSSTPPPPPRSRWNFNDIDTSAVRENLSSWLLKTQNFISEVATPLVKTGQSKKSDPENALDTLDLEDIFMPEQTIQSKTATGNLSLAAIISIEQFSRMNGLTGEKMQRIFKTLVPKSIYDDSRNLVEYCCFRFLSRDSSGFHPCLKEPAFQKLIFITMLAWENPYHEGGVSDFKVVKKASFQKKLVSEEAFVRIAPSISGVADRPTVHNLFKALAGDGGISLGMWCTYIKELIRVHEGRKSHQIKEFPQLSKEHILCIASSKKRPVLKWENNMIWPGQLTLTDKALYFEAVGLRGPAKAIRLDLTGDGAVVQKTKVGPLGSAVFDSAVAVYSANKSEKWVLEFVDLGGEMRRDVWHAFIGEVIAFYRFVREYGPEDGDPSASHVYGAHKGKERAITCAINAIARLQALRFMRRLLDDPTKLVQFSYLQNAPYGSVVYQTLAVNYWGGQLISKFADATILPTQRAWAHDEVSEGSHNLFDIDGSVFLRKWMRSPSWNSSASITFWKNSSVRQGVVLSKNHVVANTSLVERAALTCKNKYLVVEKTQATIDAAMIKGIPSNIDLFKELILPLSVAAKSFEKLRHWEEPRMTLAFLVFSYTVIFRNLLAYIFPTTLAVLATSMLLVKALKEQGRLGRSFGKVTIRDQPPSNTIQKIIAVKEAMLDFENFLQGLNVQLLKVRTIFLSDQPQVTTEVALVLLASAAILFTIPFRYIIAFLLFDMFTRELEFRREMVLKFMTFVKERWDTVPATPVIVLPFESEVTKVANVKKEEVAKAKAEKTDIVYKSKLDK